MKNKFRIVESDKFYIQRKTIFGWRYIHHDDFQEGWQAFFFIAGLIGAVCTIISIIVNIVFYYQTKPLEISMTIVFVFLTILMVLAASILRNYKRKSYSSVDQAKESIECIILDIENEIENIKNRKIEKEEKKEKRKKKKFHYLDIKIERKEKLDKIKGF
jgi:ABC-type multidrug transport system fused ATPase/permease subunit